MKPTRVAGATERRDERRKATRLSPIRKSGKERHQMYSALDEEEVEIPYRQRESVLDYFDEEEEQSR